MVRLIEVINEDRLALDDSQMKQMMKNPDDLIESHPTIWRRIKEKITPAGKIIKGTVLERVPEKPKTSLKSKPMRYFRR